MCQEQKSANSFTHITMVQIRSNMTKCRQLKTPTSVYTTNANITSIQLVLDTLHNRYKLSNIKIGTTEAVLFQQGYRQNKVCSNFYMYNSQMQSTYKASFYCAILLQILSVQLSCLWTVLLHQTVFITY